MFNLKKILPVTLMGLSVFVAPQVGSAHAPAVLLPVHHAARLLPTSFSSRFVTQSAVQTKLQALLASRLSAGAFRTQTLIKTTTESGISSGATNQLLGTIKSGQILDRFYEGGSLTGTQTLYGQELDTFGSNPLNNGSTALVKITNTASAFSYVQTKGATSSLLPLFKFTKNALPAHLSGSQIALNNQYSTITRNAVLFGNKLGNQVQGGLFSGYFYSGTAPGTFTQSGTYVLAFGNNPYNRAGIPTVPFIKANYIEVGGKTIPISSGQVLSTYYQLNSGSTYRGQGFNVYGIAGSLLNKPGHAPIYVSPSSFIAYLLR